MWSDFANERIRAEEPPERDALAGRLMRVKLVLGAKYELSADGHMDRLHPKHVVRQHA